MNERSADTTATSSLRRHLRIRALVTTGTALMVLASAFTVLTGGTTASAYTVTGSSGSPGAASVPRTVGTGTYPNATIVAGNRTVTESPAYARYDQWVCVTPRLWTLQGTQWKLLVQRSSCGWIPAASSSVALLGVTFTGMRTITPYGVDVVVTWRLANNALVGQRTYDYNASSDYACSGAACSVLDSPQGAYMFFYF